MKLGPDFKSHETHIIQKSKSSNLKDDFTCYLQNDCDSTNKLQLSVNGSTIESLNILSPDIKITDLTLFGNLVFHIQIQTKTEASNLKLPKHGIVYGDITIPELFDIHTPACTGRLIRV